ncbi:hypothetical protein KIN20_029591 [Parelaphostrongylus tenuis]|uniref:Uncharacterized protein n=1 Tax=Parelaphostrongylus tenuis TaxID=148309 RepID=A0AAD5R2L4_PARTN|nr:hypothetical protein KIN20_029591 [Parelaphostrongylus tenuis]
MSDAMQYIIVISRHTIISADEDQCRSPGGANAGSGPSQRPKLLMFLVLSLNLTSDAPE